ncbi:hypothetical protein I4U23_005545 [Adineta vaga]|nr:hypothetical protein I4U23_005545 [Adineta vaga]
MASDGPTIDIDSISIISSVTNCTTQSTESNTYMTSSTPVDGKIVEEISQILELTLIEEKDQIISDVLTNGRQALVKYQGVLIPEVYSAEIDNSADRHSILTSELTKESPLLKVIKQYVGEQWEAACLSQPKIWEFMATVKNENSDHFEAVLQHTAEYGSTYTQSSSILAVVLQMLFCGIDDHCLKNESVFTNLWRCITNEGLQACHKFSQYISQDDLNEQLNDPQSALFLALRIYYFEKIPQLFKQHKIPDSKNQLYKLAAENVTKMGWLAGIESVKARIQPVRYNPLFEAVKAMIESPVSTPESFSIQESNESIHNNASSSPTTNSATTETENLFEKFRNTLIDLLREYEPPLEEIDINQVSNLLYDEKLEALENIKDILMDHQYKSFQEKFINHPEIKNIWKAKSSDANALPECDYFAQFETELKSLWRRYQISDELDFHNIAQRLFDDDITIFEIMEDYLLPVDFEQFKNNFMESEKIKEIRQARKQYKQDPASNIYNEFRIEMIKHFKSENVPSDKVDYESLFNLLFDDQDKITDILNDHLKNIVIPKKIKNLINKIQSDETLKKLWNLKLSSEPIENSSSILKNILKKHHITENMIDMIVSELNLNFTTGLKMLEDECTPEDFMQIKSELTNNKDIRNQINNITDTGCLLSEEKTNKELLEIEFAKIWKDNNFKVLEQSLFNQFIQCLLENGIEQAIELITPKMIKRHLSLLINAINNNEKIQNMVSKPKEDDEKYTSIKDLQNIMLGCDEYYSEDLFSKIILLDFLKFQNIVKQGINEHNQPLIDIMLPFIVNKIKKGIDLSGLSASEIFWDDTLSVYGTDYKTIIVCMIERYKNHQTYIISLLKKLSIALPFAYEWIINNKLMYKIPLRAYSYCLSTDCPIVISLGSNSIGKSTLLNKIFNTQFITNKVGRINGGIDAIFSTPEFSCGFTIFDVHGHVPQLENLLKIFCYILPMKNCWIFLQTTSFEETNMIFKILKSFSFDDNQIICIMRDYRRLTNEHKEKLQQKKTEHILSICKIEHGNPEFDSNLVTLREKLFTLIGIGEKTAKLPNNGKLREEDYNVYIEIENKVYSQQFDTVYFDIQDEQTKKFSIHIDKLLKSIDRNMRNLQSYLFKHIEANNKIQEERRKKAKLIGKDSEEKAVTLSLIDQSINQLAKNKALIVPSDLVLEYNKIFIEQKFDCIIEMDKRVCAWQNPILSPLFKQRNAILDKLKIYQTKIQTLEMQNKNSAELTEAKRFKEELEKQKIENSDTIDKQTINKDFFMRELLSMFGDDDFLTKQSSINSFNKDSYINAFVEYISKGNEIEIIDGDNNEFNTKIVAEIFRRLESKLGEIDEPYVVSVIGPQSTGKSTLLNMLFGSNFQMSAGRCTKGLYASLFKTNYPNAKTLMVLDTEGLMSIEKANEEYDKKLTVFSMACSQIMLINLNGEINAAMKKILTISLFAANQLKMFKTRPIIIFILRNMMDLNVDKQKEMIDSIKRELKEVSELCQVDLAQVLDFKEEKAFFLMLTAFNKDSIYNKDKELFQTSTTNAKFAELIQDLRKIVFDEAVIVSKNEKKFKSLTDWVKQATEIWATLNLFNSILMIDSIKEINDRKELGEIITRIMQNYIEPNAEKTSFRSKLEIILTEQEAVVNYSDNFDCDVEQRFEEEEQIFTTNVKHEFKQETEKRSYAEKLLIEYNDRLCYAIKSSKTQAVQKYKAIAQKRKIQGKIEAALADLQMRSETKILEWQKAKENISDDAVNKKKDELKIWFKNSMDETLKQIKQNLDANKKTIEQWRNFVKNQIISATGTIPVEKVFYSVITLQQKAAEMISSCNNIITLIECQQQALRNKEVLKKIPILMNNRRKAARTNKPSSSNTPAIPARVTHEKLHIQRSENKIVAKWKQFTAFVVDLVPFLSETKNGNPNQVQNQRNSANQQELNDLYDVCIDSDALVLIYSMFFEMSDYLKNKIGKEVFERAEYEIICLKQHLLEIQAKMTELSQKFLDDNDLEFTVTFGTELVEWLYDIILEKMITDEKKTYEKLEKKAIDDIHNLLQDFQSRLDRTFSDMDNGECMAQKLFHNIKTGCLTKTEREYKRNLKQETILQPTELVRKSDEVFYEKNGQYNCDDIYDYITKMLEYMRKVYTRYFDGKDVIVKNKCENDCRKFFNEECQNLIENLKQLESIFKDSKTTDVQVDNDSDCIRDFFKPYLEGRNALEQLKKLNEKHSLQLRYSHPKELDNPDILFKNISIYPITNPKVFLAAITNKIQSLYQAEMDTSESKFILTDDMLKERDQVKDTNLQEALGCIEQCPFCGCKCEEGAGRHDTHQSNKHRLMAFNESYEVLPNGRKGFVFDLCNSEFTIRHSKWKEHASSQLSIHENKEIRERMNQYSVGQGEVTISLIWHDSNDLDLHVACPCGTDLYYGHTKCSTCSGYLDRDMNVCYHDGTCPANKCSSTTPIENVYFRPAKSGIYTVSVHYFSGPKGKAGSKTNFEVRVQTHSGASVQTFNGYVESSGSQKQVQVGQYEHSQGLNFLEHVKKNFPAWRNIRIINDKSWENVLKKAWYQVGSRMSQHYGFENNTPTEFRNLTV